MSYTTGSANYVAEPINADVDMSKDITMVAIGSDYCSITMDLPSLDAIILQQSLRIAEFQQVKYITGLTDDLKQIADLQIKHRQTFIEFYKVKRLLFVSFINKKDMSKFAPHIKSKLTKYLRECMDSSQELVELGAMKEETYLRGANSMKVTLEVLTDTIDIYTLAQQVFIGNNIRIKVDGKFI